MECADSTPSHSPKLAGAKRLKRIGSIAELRTACQDPVRWNNDLAGALFGWRVSIYLTSIFLRMGLSANVASWMMLLSGFTGSLLMLGPGWFRVAGAFLITIAFVLDCVDGEMARFYEIDSYRWAAFDYIHHMTVKGLAFFCLGVGLYLEYDNAWAIAAGAIGSIFWLLLMAIRDLATSLFSKKIVLDDGRGENPAYQRMQQYLEQDEVRDPEPSGKGVDDSVDVWGADFRFGPWMVRSFLTSFDVAALLLLLGALAELFVAPLGIAGHAFSLTALLLVGYALILPLHTADLLHAAMCKGGLRSELYDLAGRIDRFRNDG